VDVRWSQRKIILEHTAKQPSVAAISYIVLSQDATVLHWVLKLDSSVKLAGGTFVPWIPFVGIAPPERQPIVQGDPEAKVRLDPLVAFGGAASRTFRGL
jgi:hypothetical protein